MAGRLGVGQGALAWMLAGSLLLANACSGDSDVTFAPPPDTNGGNAGSGGNSKLNNTHGGGSGASTAGGSNASSGSAHGGSAQGGNDNAGSDTGGNATAGNATAGNATAGSGTAGSGTSGRGNAGSSAGGMAGMGGVAGTAGSASGAGGKAGNGGAAGNGGTTAGNGGTAGTTAGNGGMAGMSGSGGGGSGDCVAASFGGHSYYFCGVVDSATAAFSKCQGLGMAMISVETMAENTFALGKQKGSSWLGGTDQLEEGEWRWASTGTLFWEGGPKGTEIDGTIDGMYNDFLVDQPNDNGADETHENCLGISASGWNDLACTLGTLRAACESTGP